MEGYLQDYPDYWTQGETIDDLKEHLKDLHQHITSGQIPGIRKVEELVVDAPEREGSEEARARRRSQIRTRTARAKNWGSVLTWFPLLLALLVIAYMIYNFDAIKGRKPKPSPVPSVFPVEIDRGG